VALVSFIGFADAFYLTVKHYLGETPGCSFLLGCGTVLNSQYSTIVGIPVALLGTFYYLGILFLAILYLDRRQKSALQVLVKFTWLGFFASIWFVGLMAFVIKALCLYCLISATTSTVLFIQGRLLERKIN
jgi:uncharacterized membrane protein